MTLHIGCTGWAYDDWYQNGFYRKEEEKRFKDRYRGGEVESAPVYRLWRYAQFFDCTEIDSFYYADAGMLRGLPLLSRRWAASTPPHFRFTAKFPGSVTHEKKTTGVKAETHYYLRGLEPLGKKLACLLLQFPASYTRRRHWDDFVAYARALPEKFTYAVEFRAEDWQHEEAHKFLARHRITLVASEVSDPGVVPNREVRPGPLAYVRLIGRHGRFQTFERMRSDPKAESTLDQWAKRISALSNKEVYVFVNNNFAGNAPETANALRKLVKEPVKEWRDSRSLSEFQ